MTNLLMVDNILYAIFEVPGPAFMLKSELINSLEQANGEILGCANVYESFKFNDKYYGYYQVKQKQKENEENVSNPV